MKEHIQELQRVDHESKTYALITVSGEVATVAYNPNSLAIDILDYDELKADHSLFTRLSDGERAFLAKHDKEFFAELTKETAINLDKEQL